MLTKLTLFNERDTWQIQEELIRMLLVKCPQVELETLNSRQNWNLGMLVFEEVETDWKTIATDFHIWLI